MTEEELDNRDEFLSRIGIRVYEPREVNVGEILGTVSENDHFLKINYINGLHLNPSLSKLDYFPHVKLAGPAFGLTISDDIKPTGYQFLILRPQEASGRVWAPHTISEHLSEKFQRYQREFLEGFGADEKNERAYMVQDERYRNLGKLILSMEMPSLSFLPQSLNLDELIDWIDNARDEMEILRQTSANLKRILHCS
ncbi:hypothetical protein CMI45_01470 [Candidatus Pacearchaeota archaeon]|jgi:hypothetical protein|nr:hypothetical protein [Candidatus Pacearchaeota archaeon]|tara:strand:+ start:3553 stop:4143 length:591 start_codon:yes stop_codon:yes gene_type:complete